jgi:hypothetical protein
MGGMSALTVTVTPLPLQIDQIFNTYRWFNELTIKFFLLKSFKNNHIASGWFYRCAKPPASSSTIFFLI